MGHYGGNDDGSGRAFLYSGGVRRDLGTLSAQHTFSSGQALNSAGTVVGVSSPSFFSNEGERAFIYKDGTMQDLNSLVPPDSARVYAQGSNIALPVEFVGKVPGFSWLTQIVVRLPDELDAAGDVQLTVSFRGRTSNRAVVNIAAVTGVR